MSREIVPSFSRQARSSEGCPKRLFQCEQLVANDGWLHESNDFDKSLCKSAGVVISDLRGPCRDVFSLAVKLARFDSRNTSFIKKRHYSRLRRAIGQCSNCGE